MQLSSRSSSIAFKGKKLQHKQQFVPIKYYQQPSQMIVCNVEEGLGSQIGKFAKKVQGALPIIGLLSKLTAAEGGFGDQSYSEFCRSMLESGSEEFNEAVAQFGKRFGETGQRKYVMFVLWQLKLGVGLIEDKDLFIAVRGIAVRGDLEVEVEQFEYLRTEELKKYQFVEQPKPKSSQVIELGVDMLCELAGKKESNEVTQEDQIIILGILKGINPQVSIENIEKASKSRQVRYGSYKY